MALLFAQLATAAYACPELAPPDGTSSAAPASDCEAAHAVSRSDEEDGLLCKASCEQGAQVLKASSGFDAAKTAVVLYLAPSISSRDLVSSSVALAVSGFDRRPPGWPPAYLLHHVLRN
ncbi:MAG TPA: hypothetical protein VD791_10465 [Burkholderiales bacterium]|nr:hypothetical protein [Burkholderiales bacterium]